MTCLLGVLPAVMGHESHAYINGSLISTCEQIDMYSWGFIPSSIMHSVFVVCAVANFIYVSRGVGCHCSFLCA
jgi:hypothetical protein